MTTRGLLRRARSIIEKPSRWNRESNARDRDGKPCHPHSNRAVKFCLYGAMDRAATPEGRADIQRAHTVACTAVHAIIRRNTTEPGKSLPRYAGPATFNDAEETKHGDVLAVLDQAIKEAPEFEEQYERNRASV